LIVTPEGAIARIFTPKTVAATRSVAASTHRARRFSLAHPPKFRASAPAWYDPLLYRERLDYLAAIRQALAGVDGARIVLVKARQRLEGPPSGK
jgi:hypothetical protein